MRKQKVESVKAIMKRIAKATPRNYATYADGGRRDPAFLSIKMT